MTNQIQSENTVSLSSQHLSELMDDCAAPAAVDDLLASETAQNAWYRYNTVRSVIKNEHSTYSSYGFTQSIAQKIADEPAILARPGKTKSIGNGNIIQFWKRAGGSLAIAASVAYAMVFSVQMMNSNPADGLGAGIDTATVQSSQFDLRPRSAAETEEQARLDAIQNMLDTMSKTRLNAYEQQVGGEWIFSREIKVQELQDLEREVDNMKKPSEVNSQKE